MSAAHSFSDSEYFFQNFPNEPMLSMTRRTSAYGTISTRLSQSRRNSHGDLSLTADMMQPRSSSKMAGGQTSSSHNNDLERFSNGDGMTKRDTSRKRYIAQKFKNWLPKHEIKALI